MISRGSLVSRAKWAHPTNPSHQRKWIEAVEYLQSKRIKATIELDAELSASQTKEPASNERKD